MGRGALHRYLVAATALVLAAVVAGEPAAAGEPLYKAEFADVGLFIVEAYVRIDFGLDLSEEECQDLVRDMVYGELRAKLPSLLIYKDEGAAWADFLAVLREEGLLPDDPERLTEEERLALLQAGAALSREFLRRTAWIQVFVNVSGRGGGGYYGGINLEVRREVQVPPPAPWLNGEEAAGSFRAVVYRNGYYLTRGVSYGVRESVRETVSDLLVEFVSDFYEARPDL